MLQNNKKKGISFGLKQACDCAMLVGAILIIVALCLNNSAVKAFNVLMIIACIIYALAACVMIVKSVLTLINKQINHRSPEYKQAIVITVMMGIVFVVAVVGLVVAFVG